MSKPINVTIVGGGMITHDQILPSIYHMQRDGKVGKINISSLNTPPLEALANEPLFRGAFPGQSFNPLPSLDSPSDEKFPDLYKEVIAAMAPRQAVVVAMPDQLHYMVIMEALRNNQKDVFLSLS